MGSCLMEVQGLILVLGCRWVCLPSHDHKLLPSSVSPLPLSTHFPLLTGVPHNEPWKPWGQGGCQEEAQAATLLCSPPMSHGI